MEQWFSKGGLLEHCHWENPVFTQGLFWIGVLVVTYAGTLYYKCKEARDKENEELNKYMEQVKTQRARREAAMEPKLIQPLARPVEKKIEIPVYEVAVKAETVPKTAAKRPEPVAMVEQTPISQQRVAKEETKEETAQAKKKTQSKKKPSKASSKPVKPEPEKKDNQDRAATPVSPAKASEAQSATTAQAKEPKRKISNQGDDDDWTLVD